MILQALYEYYQRKASDPGSNIAPAGWEKKEIKFIINISATGIFKDLIDMRENKVGHFYLLPKSVGRSGSNSWQVAYFLWDHYGYVLGYPKDDSEKSIIMAKKQNETFVKQIESLSEPVLNDKGIQAILSFYRSGQISKVYQHSLWIDCAAIPGCNLTFRLDSDKGLISERQLVKEYISSSIYEHGNEEKNNITEGCCLITGSRGPIQRKHTATPIPGSQSVAKLVSFQKNSGYDSYRKEQAFNAPISIKAEGAYSTALKVLLDKESNNKLLLRDITTIFWAEKNEKTYNLEENFRWFIDDSPKDDPDKGIRAIKGLYESIKSGKRSFDEQNRFYVLGLSPNAARISVRFWKVGAVTEFGERIKQHFDDFEIIKSKDDPEYLALSRILRSIVLDYKMENVSPNLAGKVIESIIDGTPYPETLLNLCINRIRAERHVTRARAAILKACINRHNRFYNKTEKEVKMSLDRTNVNVGYRLGRLFAVLEKIDEEGGSGTIRERFYSAASSSPGTVFSRLLTLKNHHLAKLENIGRKVNFEKEIGEIFSEITDFPSHLTLKEQSHFAIGYYHQRQEYFKPKNEN